LAFCRVSIAVRLITPRDEALAKLKNFRHVHRIATTYVFDLHAKNPNSSYLAGHVPATS